MRSLRKLVFGISLKETTFARRGFWTGGQVAKRRLEHIGRTFLHGYHAAIEDDQPEVLAFRLDAVEPEFRGFAFEGASMGLALQDYLTPWRRDRFQAFLAGPGTAHAYMVHVGFGWALARLRRRLDRPPARLDNLLGWLALDGYGFHEGYFRARHYVEHQAVHRRLSGYAHRVFDQGLGRSLWFVDGADVARIPKTIAAFPQSRHADLWSGVGLACSYAGGADAVAIEDLRRAAGAYVPHLAQGAVFAASARQRAGNPAPETDLACNILCGLTACVASDIADKALVDLPRDGGDGSEPSYQVWRWRIRAQFGDETQML